MKTSRYFTACLLSFAVVSFGVFVSSQYNWPDFVHTNYGFPFVWATHTTITIAGPVDKWNVSLTNLFLNMIFWTSISLFIYWEYLSITDKKRERAKGK